VAFFGKIFECHLHGLYQQMFHLIYKIMNQTGKIALGLLLTATVSAGVSYMTVSRLQSNSMVADSFGNNIHAVALNAGSGLQTDFTIAAEQSVNAVVHIAAKSMRNVNQVNDIFEYFFGFQGQPTPRTQQPQVGFGSGVIISSDGYIVTNNHVVQGADELTVTLNERMDYPAKVVGTDPSTDLALIKIDAKNLPVIPFGNSDNLKIGEWVLAVGNPLNLTSTVTAGIVSAKARNLGLIDSEREQGGLLNQNQGMGNLNKLSLESFIQTDAAVNQGNSGGALVNLKGELVGINTAIISQTGSYAGYSFAIPINIVAKVVGDIRQYGQVQRAMLGVTISDINSGLAQKKKIDVQDGAYVENVGDMTGAMEAGIKAGDIIKAVDGKKIKSSTELQTIIGLHHPSDVVEITLLREGKEKTFKVKLRNVKGGTETVKNAGLESLGAAFKELTAEEKRSLNIGAGIKVNGVSEGKFKDAGIRKGYVILKINGVSIGSVEQMEKLIDEMKSNASADNSILFITGLYPSGRIIPYAIDLGE